MSKSKKLSSKSEVFHVTPTQDEAAQAQAAQVDEASGAPEPE